MAYSEEEKKEIVTRVCNYMVEEKASLRQALELHTTPNRDTFYEWLKKSDEFSDQYAHACQDRADEIFEEMLEIADSSNADIEIIDGKIRINGEAVQRSKLKVDTRKWMLSKMNPKKYGHKVDVTSDGEKVESSQINVSYNGKELDLSS